MPNHGLKHHLFIFFQYGPANQNQLAEACFVVNVLDPKVKKDLLAWFVKLQLSEYLVLFGEDQDVSIVIMYYHYYHY